MDNDDKKRTESYKAERPAEPIRVDARRERSAEAMRTDAPPERSKMPSLPAPTLPKGGGALAPIGEKFVAHPQTGTAGFSIPIATSPGRNGFGPSLSLDYDSGAGQGPWGLGWSMSIPAISRRTQNGLPRYSDEDESDVFVLAGAEDLVPVKKSGSVVTYRPRVEAGYARIERHGDYWVVYSRDNVRSVFGYSPDARIADPATGHIFRWLLEWSDNDRGDVIVYTYKKEDDVGISPTASEIGRSHNNRYLKGIGYGQATMRLDRTAVPSKNLADHPLVVLFDYGDNAPVPKVDDALAWPARPDSFSNYRAGFEIRTHRLCQRIYMMHRFGVAEHEVVRSIELHYPPSAAASTLSTVTVIGWQNTPAGYAKKSMPPVQLGYSSADLRPHIDRVDPAVGVVDGQNARWVDLDAEALPGILREQAGGSWWYQRPEGDGWGRPAPVRERPSVSLADGWQLQDVDGDGQVDLVKIGEGAWNRRDAIWRGYRRFETNANIDFTDPNLRFVDLDGDGLPDILVHSGGVFRWHRSLGPHGYGGETRTPLPEPIPLFSTAREVVALADMTGDGLSDIVHIKPGAVSYWPNLGYGRFGARIAMENAPALDSWSRFEPRRVTLADLDGTGTADLVYFGADGVVIARNQAGNSFAPAEVTHLLPAPHGDAAPSVMDIWGLGIACLVQTSTARVDTAKGQAIRVVELFDQKPYLLTSIDNSLGLQTSVTYASSTKYSLADRSAGRPWLTRLPFPVHVVDTAMVYDSVAETRVVTTYRYHHGHYDGVEREFRGFAMVEQQDTQTLADFAGKSEYPRGLDPTLHIPPALTKTWFHTGVFLDSGVVSRQLASEYFTAKAGTFALPDSPMPLPLLPDEQREACRALRGKPLRVEVYALDGNDAPYSIAETNYTLIPEVRRGTNRYAVFSALPRETLTVHLERVLDDPRIQHEIAIAYGHYGDVTEKVSIAYPRSPAMSPRTEQQRLWALHAQTTLVDHDADPLDYRVAIPVETVTSELIGLPADHVLSFQEVFTGAAVATQPYVHPTKRTSPGRWLVRREQVRYRDDAAATELPAGQAGIRALVSRSLTVAVTKQFLDDTWQGRESPAEIEARAAEAGYLIEGDLYWAYAGQLSYDSSQFFLPRSLTNPFGGVSTVHYETPYLLLPDSATDPALNRATFANDYRLLTPKAVTDPNLTTSSVTTDPLGVVIATSVAGPSGEGGALTTIDYAFSAPSWVHVQTYQQFSNTSPVEQTWIYSDASGRECQRKQLVPDGPLDPEDPSSGTLSPRYVATGRTVFNNKGLPVKKYEPYFSTTSDFDAEPAIASRGVTPILQYDPLGRLFRTDFPNGTYSETDFAAWSQTISDEIDTLTATSPWYNDRIGGTYPREPALEKATAIAAFKLTGTPTVVHFDALGRVVATVRDAGTTAPPFQYYETSQFLDIAGAIWSVTDPRNITTKHTFDIGGRCVLVDSPDAGLTWTLPDTLGQPLYGWRAAATEAERTRIYRQYDKARRVIGMWERPGAATADVLRERVIYRDGAGVPDHGAGRVYAELDGAGVVHHAYEFRGQPATTTRHALSDGTKQADWTSSQTYDGAALPSGVDPTAIAVAQTWDAASRQLTRSASVGTRASGTVTNGYDIGGRLTTVNSDLPARGATRFVSAVDYDAKGRRHTATWGHGGITTYHHDPFTFRLDSLTTKTGATTVQALVYAYDPVGNITAIRDDAQDVYYRAGKPIPPTRTYGYDALYRLISADGREHLSQAQPDQRDIPDPLAFPPANPADFPALIAYSEKYAYDASGNLASLAHKGALSWTRTFTVDATTNRLQKTTVDGFDSTYVTDKRGNVTSMAHLASMTWSYRDQLIAATRTRTGNTPDPNAATATNAPVYFAHDCRGQRARKTTTTAERLYVAGFELYKEGSTERETLHILDGGHRIALVETQTAGGSSQIVRYQHDDHLASATVELDDSAAPLSYEEFTPYGTTALFAGLASKRYRFTAMERDEETGLQIHGVRCYAPWLGRWISADPKGMVDGPNVYQYAHGSPTNCADRSGTKNEGLQLTLPHLGGGSGTLRDRAAEFIGHSKLSVPLPAPSKGPLPGSALEQAQSLTRHVERFGHLKPPIGQVGPALPDVLKKLLNSSVTFTPDEVARYLRAKGISEKDIGGSVFAPITKNYFTIHDTSHPLSGQSFPANIDTDKSLNDLSKKKAEKGVHVYVNRLGASRTVTDFARDTPTGKATQFEIAHGRIGVNIELIQPRLKDSHGIDSISPTPGFTDAQYDRLALLYAAASTRRGEYLIPTFHAVLDFEVTQDSHDDPQGFDLAKFASHLQTLIQAILATDAVPERGDFSSSRRLGPSG